jgi:chromosome segregation ATPase
MKLRANSLAIYTMFLLGAASFMGGCATTGVDRSVRTSNSITDVDAEIRKIVIQSDATKLSLDTLVSSAKPDLKKSFDKYSDDLAKLDNDGQRLLKRIEEMKTHSKEYFSEWEKQGDSYTNQQIRELSEDRRIKLAEIYARVHTAGGGIKGAYISYLTNLKEIKLYLSNDLTPKGVEAIDPVAKKAAQDLEVLKESLKPVLAALDEIKAELYTGKK